MIFYLILALLAVVACIWMIILPLWLLNKWDTCIRDFYLEDLNSRQMILDALNKCKYHNN